MFRRPLFLILGVGIIGGIVAFLSGKTIYYRTSLDKAYSNGLSQMIIEGITEEVSYAGSTACATLSSYAVFSKTTGEKLKTNKVIIRAKENLTTPAGYDPAKGNKDTVLDRWT